RREAVGRAGGVRDHVVAVTVVDLVEVHAQHDGRVRLGGGGGYDDLLGAAGKVLGGVLALGEEAGRLDHDVYAEIAPWQRRRVALGEHLQLLAVDRDRAVADLDGARVWAEDRVVLEQVAEGLRVGEVVHRDPLDAVASLRHRRTKRVAADATEPVDPDPYRHPFPPGRK